MEKSETNIWMKLKNEDLFISFFSFFFPLWKFSTLQRADKDEVDNIDTALQRKVQFIKTSNSNHGQTSLLSDYLLV